jgi:hypothetical protein
MVVILSAAKDINSNFPCSLTTLKFLSELGLFASEMTAKQKPGCKSCYFSDQRLKISAAFVPPNPNEFDNAYSTAALRATFGT